MKRQLVTLLMFLLLGTLFQVSGVGAVTMSDYTAVPPFIADSVVPNVLVLMDKSGSMGRRADCDIGSGAFTNFDACPTFVETQTYTGLYDFMKCYSYDVANTRFNVTTSAPITKATISTACNTADWDGNFLNWVTLRRIDAFKLAWIGGSCAATRNADGTCPATAGQITLKGVDRDVFNSGDTMVTSNLPTNTVTANNAHGRMPDAVIATFPLNTILRIHLMGNNATTGTQTLVGSFCVDDDRTPPRENNANCTGTEIGGAADPGTTHSQPFKVRVSVAAQSTGVIQETGEKVRFGLTEFLGNDGAYVMVPIGSRQVKPWNQVNAAVTTYATNVAAMVHAIEATNNEGNTPLGESLYESLLYIAQIDSSFTTTQYRHPFGFGPAVALGVNGRGSLGGTAGNLEIKVLSGTETCPTNLPPPYTAQTTGYNVTDACGRDPYFYGSEHDASVPTGWANQSAVVLCCKTFVIVSTDGEPTQDTSIPAALQNFASAVSGTTCTGGSATIHAPDGTCNTNQATPPNFLLGEHKTDYGSSGTHYLNDVAYWGHIRDLRQATIPDIGGTGRDLPGKQNVTVYSFFTFGNIAGRELLMHTAQQGGFEDKNGNDLPDNGLTPAGPCVTGGPCEYDSVNNATGAAGPDGIPDTFFESANAAEIKAKLTQTFTSILQRTSSGTSLSVLATSSTGEGALYQSYFYPEFLDSVLTASPRWVGFTHGLFIDTFGNIREDTTNDGVLVYNQDRIIKTHFDSASNKLLLDYYLDADGNGLPDDRNLDGVITTADCLPCNQQLSTLTPIWEAGKRLALTSPANRRILTWVDSAVPAWNGVVDGGRDNGVHTNVSAGEVIPFEQSNCSALKDYLQASADPCNGSGTGAAEQIIDFIRGVQVTGMRNRLLTVGGGPQVWKLGDPIHSTPTEVGPPRERYDVIYGDAGYGQFYQKWRDRRRMIYMGANDGMLHAFNGGVYHRGDDSTTGSVTEHGWFTTTAVSGTRGQNLGDEIWSFVPMQLLPHLKWLTQADYTHVYYVDLKPKITEARIFTAEGQCASNHLDAACKHPGGWGTILIGGFRMGGSCGNCQVGKGAPTMTVNIGGTNRNFYSAYFVLDITDPESDPKLLWVFSDAGLGLTTGYPSVLRVNPTADPKTSSTNEKWFMVVGSGPNSYAADLSPATAQTPRVYAINLNTGPGAGNVNVNTYLVESLNPTWKGFMGEAIAFDRDLDYRVDAAYFGSSLDDGSLPWRGKLYRLTMGLGTVAKPFGGVMDPTQWGINPGAGAIPTEVVNTFPTASPVELGPVTTAPGIALDDSNNVWVFAGTGRYYSMSDKTNTETQYFVGVKDSVMAGTGACDQTVGVTACVRNDLLDVSNVNVCQVGQGACNQSNQVTGLATATSFLTGATSLVSQVKSKQGWFTTLTRSRERVIANPIVLGGVVFFPSFVPDNDICSTSGDSYLFALYYVTGSAYQESVIGTSGGNINKSVYLDRGVSSSVAIHIGSQGPGNNPSAVQGCVQASSAAISCVNMTPPNSVASRYLSWIHQRD